MIQLKSQITYYWIIIPFFQITVKISFHFLPKKNQTNSWNQKERKVIFLLFDEMEFVWFFLSASSIKKKIIFFFNCGVLVMVVWPSQAHKLSFHQTLINFIKRKTNLFFSISSCSMNLLFSLLFEKWAVGEVKEEERRAPGAKTYNQLSRNLKFFEFQWREQAKTTFLPFHFTKKRKDNSTNWSFLYLFYFSEEKKSFVFFSLLN